MIRQREWDKAELEKEIKVVERLQAVEITVLHHPFHFAFHDFACRVDASIRDHMMHAHVGTCACPMHVLSKCSWVLM